VTPVETGRPEFEVLARPLVTIVPEVGDKVHINLMLHGPSSEGLFLV